MIIRQLWCSEQDILQMTNELVQTYHFVNYQPDFDTDVSVFTRHLIILQM